MDEREWSDAVRAARAAGDRPLMRLFFTQAVEEWGRADASTRWFHLMSEADDSAQTG